MDTIRRLEERLLDPSVRSSPDELSALIADEFLEIGVSGRKYSKQDVINKLTVDDQIKSVIVENEAFALTPTTVLLIYKTEQVSGDGGMRKVSMRSSIWKSFDGRWKIVFHQGTPLNHA